MVEFVPGVPVHPLALLVPMLAAQSACDTDSCARRGEAERLACVVATCDPGASGDLCRVEHVGELTRTQDVLDLARAIHDPVLRDTAVIRWTRDREAGMRRADALSLCDILTDQEKSACRRRLSTPHLQR